VIIVPHLTQRYFLPIINLLAMMLMMMKMMAKTPLIRITGTTKSGAASLMKKYTNNPNNATPILIHPKVLMTSSFFASNLVTA
jgi:hypothetical protein